MEAPVTFTSLLPSQSHDVLYSTKSARKDKFVSGFLREIRNFGAFLGDILGGFGENFASRGDIFYFSPPRKLGKIRISWQNECTPMPATKRSDTVRV